MFIDVHCSAICLDQFYSGIKLKQMHLPVKIFSQTIGQHFLQRGPGLRSNIHIHNITHLEIVQGHLSMKKAHHLIPFKAFETLASYNDPGEVKSWLKFLRTRISTMIFQLSPKALYLIFQGAIIIIRVNNKKHHEIMAGLLQNT